jgi:hypothetical protein
MGWKGTLRSLEAEARRRDREARRRQRELERQRAQLEKMQEMERAAYEVEVYENDLEVFLSIHKDCAQSWDWEEINSAPPPTKPERSHERERSAQEELDGFKPSFAVKLLGRTESKREELVRAVDWAKQADEREYWEALEAYERDHADWEATRQLAGRILEGDPDAFADAIVQAGPFSEISGFGSSVRCQVDGSSLAQATLRVNDQVIPKESKTLLKSGKLSVKAMTKTKFYELYQDYVCGCVLRVARELFALLPTEMAIVTAESQLLNTQTGHLEMQPILSVAIPRKTLETLNFERLDPSDSLNNFMHRMKFMKTKGFKPVEALTPSAFETEHQ